MKVNYVLMYGTPYLKYREFETFEDIRKYLVNKCIVNYSIFKKLEDKEEVEMIYRDNDIHYLEKENEELRKRNKELEEGFKATIEELCDTTLELEKIKSIIKEALDKLTIKQIRFINEKDYVLDDNDLDEIMKILDKGDKDND